MEELGFPLRAEATVRSLTREILKSNLGGHSKAASHGQLKTGQGSVGT
jgi:hypothetical protein